MRKRTLTLLLALCMCLSLIPAAFADDVAADKLDPSKYTIKDGVLTINEGVVALGFEACSASTNMTGDEALEGMSGVTSVVLPASLKLIGWGAFRNCRALTSVTVLGDGELTIEQEAFQGCTNLSGFNCSGRRCRIDENALDDTPWLKSQGDLAVVGGCLFKYQGKGGDVVIPQGVTIVGGAVFYGCKGLKSVVIPEGVTEIGQSAFSQCSDLLYVDIPSSVKTIGKYAFKDCSSLVGVKIPDGVTKIERDTFQGCDAMTFVAVPPSITTDSDLYNMDLKNKPNVTIYGEAGSHAEKFAKGQSQIPFVAGPAPAFYDVPEWCADGVTWAVGKGLANGTGGGKFSPSNTCTVRDILTFLYRAAGAPAVTAANPFTDVPDGVWYTDAAIWASQQGMVSGDKLNGKDPCTRAVVVTCLWKMAGSPETDYDGSFTDVAEDAPYAEAVAWAVGKGLTNGTGGGKFSPEMVCNRGQIVTFLHRAYGK